MNIQRETTPIFDDRSLSPGEYSLTRWMLEHGFSDAAAYLAQLDQARVVSRCYCGCASIDFAIDDKQAAPGTGMQILADFLYGDETNLCGAFVFAKAGLRAGLEVYGLAVDAPVVLPSPEQLRPVDGSAVL